MADSDSLPWLKKHADSLGDITWCSSIMFPVGIFQFTSEVLSLLFNTICLCVALRFLFFAMVGWVVVLAWYLHTFLSLTYPMLYQSIANFILN